MSPASAAATRPACWAPSVAGQVHIASSQRRRPRPMASVADDLAFLDDRAEALIVVCGLGVELRPASSAPARRRARRCDRRTALRREDAVDLAVQPRRRPAAACPPARRSRTACRRRSPSGRPRRASARRGTAASAAGCRRPAASACRPARAAGRCRGRTGNRSGRRAGPAAPAPRRGRARARANMPACALHHLGGQVRRAAVAGRAVAQLARVGLDVGDELLHVVRPAASGLTTRNTSTRAAAATGIRSFAGSNAILV